MIKWLLLSALAMNLLSFFWLSNQGEVVSGREALTGVWQMEQASEIVLLSELEVFPSARQAFTMEDLVKEDGLVDHPLQDGVDMLAVAAPIEPLSPSANIGMLADDANVAGLVANQQVGERDDLQEGVQVKELLREQASTFQVLPGPKLEPELPCVIVGRFDKGEDARGLLEKLQDTVGVAAKINAVVEGLVRYLIYMPPLESRLLAKEKQAELMEAGIRSSLYYKGDLKNGLSLGYFGSRQNAERRYKSLVAEGYEVELKVAETQITRYWLELQGRDAAKLSQQFWRDMAKTFPDAGKQEVACSVAGITEGSIGALAR